MSCPNVEELLQDFFLILKAIIILNGALEDIQEQLVEAWICEQA